MPFTLSFHKERTLRFHAGNIVEFISVIHIALHEMMSFSTPISTMFSFIKPNVQQAGDRACGVLGGMWLNKA